MIRMLLLPVLMLAVFPFRVAGKDVEVTYSYFSLEINPLDSTARAGYAGCHRLHWHTTEPLGESDFGTVLSTEFGFRGYLLPASGTYTAADGSGNDVTRSTDRDDEGLFVFPAALYGGITFSPLTLKYLAAGVTGGIGLGIAPFPLFFTYVTPYVECPVWPDLANIAAEFTFAPKGPTDRIEVRNAFRGWNVTLRIEPLWRGLSLNAGYFDESWISENAAVTYEDRYRARGITAGLTMPLK